MYKLGNFLIGFLSVLIGLLSIIALSLTGVTMSMIALPPEWAGLMAMMPFILMGICALGIWALCTGNHIAKIAFTCIMLMFWYVGTLLGALILLCLLLGDRPQIVEQQELGLAE